MHLLNCSILKNVKFKIPICINSKKYLSADVSQVEIAFDKYLGDPSFVEFLPTWSPDVEVELRNDVFRHMQVIPNFINEEEETSLLAEVEPQLKRMRYEFDHWDNAIEGYRETERSTWSPANSAVLERVRTVFRAGASLLPHAHVLDLAAAGHIRPHVDAVRFLVEPVRPVDFLRSGLTQNKQSMKSVNNKFCGDTIAGLCLLSSAVMRLQHARRPGLTLDALLQRRSLYVMSGVARYEFTHAVLGGEASIWRGERLPRKRRVAVICREQPNPTDKP